MPYNCKTTKNQKGSNTNFETSSVCPKKENKPHNLIDTTNIENKKRSF
jgi:5'-AMP-activated protein kinase catalytic alpha subunit